MTELLGFSDLSPEQQQKLQVIRISGDVLLALIDEILDLSKIEAGQLELETRDFDLHQTLKQVVDLYRPTPDKKTYIWAWASPPTYPVASKATASTCAKLWPTWSPTPSSSPSTGKSKS